MTGYRCSADAVSCKFPHADGTRVIQPFSVGYNDGQLKVLSMIGLVSFIHELVSWLNKANRFTILGLYYSWALIARKQFFHLALTSVNGQSELVSIQPAGFFRRSLARMTYETRQWSTCCNPSAMCGAAMTILMCLRITTCTLCEL